MAHHGESEGRTGADRGPEPGADVRAGLRETYGKLAEQGGSWAGGCCGAPGAAAGLGRAGKTEPASGGEPRMAGPFLGCGDSVSLAELRPGETVLDLGCGAGRDCFLAAEAVGATGRVVGVDMTPAMLETARANRERLGAENVEFRFGEIEHLPVADASVDVVISNCVISLSRDRDLVFREAFRVLRPGGRLAVSDMMTDGPVPEALRESLGEAAQAIVEESDYVASLRAAGFEEIGVRRAYPEVALPAGRLERLRASGVKGRVAVVRIAETGEEELVELGGDAGERVAVRSFSGGVRARKPN